MGKLKRVVQWSEVDFDRLEKEVRLLTTVLFLLAEGSPLHPSCYTVCSEVSLLALRSTLIYFDPKKSKVSEENELLKTAYGIVKDLRTQLIVNGEVFSIENLERATSSVQKHEAIKGMKVLYGCSDTLIWEQISLEFLVPIVRRICNSIPPLIQSLPTVPSESIIEAKKMLTAIYRILLALQILIKDFVHSRTLDPKIPESVRVRLLEQLFFALKQYGIVLVVY